MKAGVQNSGGRAFQLGAIVFGALMMLSAIAGSAFADAVEKVTICHANNAATNPYVQEDVPLSSVDGEGNNDHTLHTGPIAISEEHAAELKANDEDWGDIIPPFGGFPGLNWDETGMEIFENDCEYESSTEDGSTDDGSTDDGSTDDGSTDDGSTDDGSTDDGSTDDGSTDDGSTDDGSTDDGSTDDGSTDDGTEVQGNVITKAKPKPEVDGEVLAQTGPETTVLSIIGSLFLMLGLALRYGYGRPAAATSVQPQVADALHQRGRGWTCAR